MQTVGQRLAEARKQAGLSQGQAAKLLEMFPTAISAYECGRKPRPSGELLAKLAELYGVSIDWLVTGKPGAMPAGLDLSKLSPPDAAAITQLVGTLSRIPLEPK